MYVLLLRWSSKVGTLQYNVQCMWGHVIQYLPTYGTYLRFTYVVYLRQQHISQPFWKLQVQVVYNSLLTHRHGQTLGRQVRYVPSSEQQYVTIVIVQLHICKYININISITSICQIVPTYLPTLDLITIRTTVYAKQYQNIPTFTYTQSLAANYDH